MYKALESLERDLDYYKGESCLDTLQEVDRNNHRYFVMSGLPHKVKQKDLDKLLNYIAVTLQANMLSYSPIRKWRALILRAGSQEELDNMIGMTV